MHRFLVDAQLPPALARKIAAMGHEAEHLLELGLLESSDSQVWDYALANGAVIITKDEDFAIRASVGKASPSIVRVRIGLPQRKIAGVVRKRIARRDRSARRRKLPG